MTTVIKIENLSKAYRLGQIGSSTLTEDLNRLWARLRSRPDPYLRIGQIDHGNRHGEYIWALKDVSLDVQQGEVLGVIGSNGAGKSTLLKILSRITSPTSGVVKVKGRIASLLEVGTGFHPELTGRENIYLNGAILGMSKEDVRRKLDEIVAFAEIEQFLDTPVKRFSSGMYVRLAFAVAAHLEPEILLVDEVLAVGDAAFQKKCLGKMSNVATEGRTILFVSHNIGAVQSLCHSSIWIDKGSIHDKGNTSEVVTKYFHNTTSSNSSNGLFKNLPRRRDITGFEFLNYTLLDSCGHIVSFARFNDPLIIRVNCHADTHISGAILAVNWFDSNGNLINRANTRNVGMADIEIYQGDNIIDFEFPSLPLVPNLYRVSIALQEHAAYYDYLNQAIEVNVKENPNSPIRFMSGQSAGTTWIPVTFLVHNTIPGIIPNDPDQ